MGKPLKPGGLFKFGTEKKTEPISKHKHVNSDDDDNDDDNYGYNDYEIGDHNDEVSQYDPVHSAKNRSET